MNIPKKREMYLPDNVMQTKEEYKLSKANKPLAERRRRERINNCLDQIKSTILNEAKLQEQKYAKMEKADILEMALKNIKGLQLQEQNRLTNIKQVTQSSYREGYNHCLQEVFMCLSNSPYVCEQVKHDLFIHLTQSLAAVNQCMETSQNLGCVPSSGALLTPTSGSCPSSMSDQSGFSSGYSSNCSDNIAYDSSSSSSLSRGPPTGCTSDNYVHTPLASSTPAPYGTDGATVGTPMSPFIQFFNSVSPYSTQQTFSNGSSMQSSDSSVFHTQLSAMVPTNTCASTCDGDSKTSSDCELDTTEYSEVWRPW